MPVTRLDSIEYDNKPRTTINIITHRLLRKNFRYKDKVMYLSAVDQRGYGLGSMFRVFPEESFRH